MIAAPRQAPRGVFLALVTLGAACAPDPNIPPRSDYAAAVEQLTAFIEHEMADKQLPGLSIVLVDDQATVWAQGFGYADPADSTPATAHTVYRVGSVSKLFTDVPGARCQGRHPKSTRRPEPDT